MIPQQRDPYINDTGGFDYYKAGTEVLAAINETAGATVATAQRGYVAAVAQGNEDSIHYGESDYTMGLHDSPILQGFVGLFKGKNPFTWDGHD
jgi:hypothetical protein